MAIQCVIIDDEPLAVELLERHITQLDNLEVAGTFKNAVLALTFIRANPVDLVFLDIQMPLLSGLDFLRSTPIAPKVILTTAYREYALEGYELKVVDYLLKPITFDRFFKAVDTYLELTRPSLAPPAFESRGALSQGCLYVKSDRKHVKIDLATILYVESIKDYIKIRTSETTILVKEKISEFEKQLPATLFVRVHRSYIVNKQQVTAFTHVDIEINSIEIPIGGNYKQQVLNALLNQS